jgi:hypothetical protein
MADLQGRLDDAKRRAAQRSALSAQANKPVTTTHSVKLQQEALEDLQHPKDFAIERELKSETPDWTTPQRAIDAMSQREASLRVPARCAEASDVFVADRP